MCGSNHLLHRLMTNGGVTPMERRKYPRTDAAVHVRLEAHGAECHGIVRDVSTRGIFVEVQGDRLDGAECNVDMHFEIDTGEQILSRRIGGTIVRSEGGGLAVRFAEQDVLARAVVHELMYYMQLCRGESLPAGGCTHDRMVDSGGGRAA